MTIDWATFDEDPEDTCTCGCGNVFRSHTKYTIAQGLISRKPCPECQRNCNYKHKYGITLEEYNEILQTQEGKCAICGRSDLRLCLDHDHFTKGVRGILCINCNTALGAFKDDPSNLERAITYLNKDPITRSFKRVLEGL